MAVKKTVITLDEESVEKLKKIRQEDDKFNLSKFIRESIKNY